MEQSLDDLAAQIIAAARVTAEDTMAMRKLVWEEGTVGFSEAETIFAINNAAERNCPQWVDFFVEAISVYLVDQADPRGYVDQAKADWFIAQIGKDGVLRTRSELLLLVAIFERAEHVDEALRAYTLAQVERIVLTGEGPTRGGEPRTGVIDDGEVALLRRVLFAPASDDGSTISDDEVRALFRIKAATLGAANATGWETLFAQAVGNHFLVPPSETLSSDRARALDAFMHDTMPNVGGFLGRMEAAFVKPSSIVEAVGAEMGDDPVKPDVPAMTIDEAHWLKAQIAADGQIDPIEKALLAFIIDEAGPLPVAIETAVALSA